MWKAGLVNFCQASGNTPAPERPKMPLSLRARCVPGLWPAYRRYETARDCLRL